MPSCRKAAGFALGVVVTLTAMCAIAQDASVADGRFAVEIESCPRAAPESVRRILSVEVGDLVLTPADMPAGVDILTVRCAGNWAWIVASGPTGAPVEQTVRIDDLPEDAVPRALALAGLELLATRSAIVRERIAGPRPQTAAQTPVAPSAEPSRQAPGPSLETHLGLAAVWRTFLASQGASTWGGQLQAESSFASRWQIAVDAEVASGSKPLGALGEVEVLALSGAALAGLHVGSPKRGASLGVGGRFGSVRLSGRSSDAAMATGASVWRPWGGPMVAVGVLLGYDHLALTVGAEIGRALLEPEGQANAATVVSMRGTWAALSLGVSIRP